MTPFQTKRKRVVILCLFCILLESKHRKFGKRLIIDLYSWVSLNSEHGCLYLHGQK